MPRKTKSPPVSDYEQFVAFCTREYRQDHGDTADGANYWEMTEWRV